MCLIVDGRLVPEESTTAKKEIAYAVIFVDQARLDGRWWVH